jgi:hypothetical protein
VSVYEPLPEQLTAQERWFLERVAPMGLDFLATRQQYRQRLGVSSYHGWKDVIALPASNALSASPLCFVMYADDDVSDLPPEYSFADFMPHDDARENRRDIEQQLSVVLGAPQVEDVSNCLKRRWSFGIFRVELHTFPPELQGPTKSKNSLHEKNPRLAINASVTIKSEYALPYPDGSLEGVADAIRGASSAVVALTSPSSVMGGPQLAPSRRYSRRSPKSLVASVSPTRLFGWRDGRGRLGVSGAFRSLVFEPALATRLRLATLEPDRGPGGLQLELEIANPPGTGAGRGFVTLLEDLSAEALRDASPLRTTAEQLATIWQLELTRVSCDGW